MASTTFEEALRQLDIVFVIDTTGSMQPCINQVRQKLKHLAQTIAAAPIHPDVAFGVVAYRDHPPQDFSYVTRVYPISRDLAQVQQVLDGLRAEGGGDEPEAVLDGVWDALHGSHWRPSSYKVIALVGDAPGHTYCPRELTFDGIVNEARQRQTLIFAVGASNNQRMSQQFKQLADGTGGLFARLDDIGKLIEKILSLLETTVMVDMEVRLAIFYRRMAGSSASEIAKQIGRPESKVSAVIQDLEAKGAKWPQSAPSADAPAAAGLSLAKSPMAGTIPIGSAATGSSTSVGRPVIVPITNLAAQSTYQVRWMGWQGTQRYELEESPDPSFAHAKKVYSGADTSWTAANQPAGACFYRVRLCDAAGHWGEWSNVQSTVVS